MYLPQDPLNRFTELYRALDADRGWFGDVSSLRSAAISALTIEGKPARGNLSRRTRPYRHGALRFRLQEKMGAHPLRRRADCHQSSR